MSRHVAYDIADRDVDDAALAERIAADDVEAFDAVYRRYYRPLVTFGARYVSSWDLAEEVIQDIFVRLWIGRHSWRLSTSLRAYLYGAVRNGALNMRKHESRVMHIHATALSARDGLGVAPPPLRADLAVERAELRAELVRVLAALPERQRAAVVLRYEHDLNYSDIGGALGISDVAARKLVLKADARLRARFEAFGT